MLIVINTNDNQQHLQMNTTTKGVPIHQVISLDLIEFIDLNKRGLVKK